MSNIVFILGAGASKDCGAPLMNDFLDTAFNLWKTSEVDEKEEHFERVFRAISSLQRVHSKSQLDINNIESVFTALEIAKVLGKLPGFKKEDIPEVINSLKEVIVATLERTIKFPVISYSIQPNQSYESFAKLIRYLKEDAHPNRSVSIITFNYDIALDFALYKEGFGPNYCIETSPQQNSYAVPLLKLHGSLNWASLSENGDVTPLELDQYFRRYNLRQIHSVKTCGIPIGSQLQEFFKTEHKKEVEEAPVIVPPTWNKADYHKTLAKVWSRAASELEDAESIFIMGYSLPETDAFFRLLYALGTVGDTPLNRLEVFDIDESGEIRKRFASMLGPGDQRAFNESFNYIKNMFPKRKL